MKAKEQQWCVSCDGWVTPDSNKVCGACWAPTMTAAAKFASEGNPTMALPDEGDWINRQMIRSGSSNRLYRIAQHEKKRHWACSCPGWISHRACKHLTTMGLPNHEQPFEPESVMKRNFLDGYETYAGQRGTPQEWANASPLARKRPAAPAPRPASPVPSRVRDQGRAISFDEE